MDNIKADRRTRRTKELLRKAMTDLLKEKELKDISVSELTQLADVNRGTFYLHYKDIYDLFEQMENEALQEFTTIITAYTKLESLEWMSIMTDLFKYLLDNADIFIAILKTKESNLLSKIIELNRPKSKEEWRRLFKTGREEYYEYYYDFLTSGCVALVRSWFNKGMPESLEQMASLVEKLMTNCTRDLQ